LRSRPHRPRSADSNTLPTDLEHLIQELWLPSIIG
jgi:hypothetical protein